MHIINICCDFQGAAKKRPQRRAAPKKRQHDSDEDDGSEEEEDEDDSSDSDEDSAAKPKKKRRSKKDLEESEDSDDNSYNDASGIPPKDYTVKQIISIINYSCFFFLKFGFLKVHLFVRLQSGAFVVAKADIGGSTDPTLWRIDGKALLQKFLPYKDDGKTLYKSTSTVSAV